jgi:hypothetical protein
MAFYQFYFFAISAAEIPIRTRLSTVPFRLEATQKKSSMFVMPKPGHRRQTPI